MTDRPLGTATMNGTDEPAPVAEQATGAGSPSSTPVLNDILRALACALLVGASVGSPTGALLFAPFVPVLVAIRLLRDRAGSHRFVLLATIASLFAAWTASSELEGGIGRVVVGLLAALLLVPALGLLHVRAARRDPIVAAEQPDWPEPRADTGFSLATIGWIGALALLVVASVPLVDSVRGLERTVVSDGYGVYERECDDGGAFDDRDEFCRSIVEQRDTALELVDSHGEELFAAFLGVFAFAGAATAHLLVLARARRSTDRVRASWRLRELEVHWSAAYLVAAGLVAFMLLTGSSPTVTAIRSIGVALGAVGMLLVIAQGVGLTAWLLTRTRTPRWYRVFVVIGSLFVLPVTVVVLFCLGVLDLALHPRRRGALSASLPGRGSGS